MISTLIGLLGGLFALLAGLFAAIFGLGVGLTAIFAAMLPILLLIGLALLPIWLLLWLLRRLGLVEGRLGRLAILGVALLCLFIGARQGWMAGMDRLRGWFDENRATMDECFSQDRSDLSLDRDGDGWHLTCHKDEAIPTRPRKPRGIPT